MNATKSRSRDNLQQFADVMTRAYTTAKGQGRISAADISIYDQLLIPTMTGVHPEGWVQPKRVNNKKWRRRVTRRYERTHGGIIPDDFDWESILAWIVENIIPLLKMLLPLLMFL